MTFILHLIEFRSAALTISALWAIISIINLLKNTYSPIGQECCDINGSARRVSVLFCQRSLNVMLNLKLVHSLGKLKFSVQEIQYKGEC